MLGADGPLARGVAADLTPACASGACTASPAAAGRTEGRPGNPRTSPKLSHVTQAAGTPLSTAGSLVHGGYWVDLHNYKGRQTSIRDRQFPPSLADLHKGRLAGSAPSVAPPWQVDLNNGR